MMYVCMILLYVCYFVCMNVFMYVVCMLLLYVCRYVHDTPAAWTPTLRQWMERHTLWTLHAYARIRSPGCNYTYICRVLCMYACTVYLSICTRKKLWVYFTLLLAASVISASFRWRDGSGRSYPARLRNSLILYSPLNYFFLYVNKYLLY
jgi:hypothetical protein